MPNATCSIQHGKTLDLLKKVIGDGEEFVVASPNRMSRKPSPLYLTVPLPNGDTVEYRVQLHPGEELCYNPQNGHLAMNVCDDQCTFPVIVDTLNRDGVMPITMFNAHAKRITERARSMVAA